MSQARDNYLIERTVLRRLMAEHLITTPPLTMREQWKLLAYYVPSAKLSRNALNAHRRNHPEAGAAWVALERAVLMAGYRPRPDPGQTITVQAEARPFDAEAYAKLVIQLARHLCEQEAC